jgi:hypothetical protein
MTVTGEQALTDPQQVTGAPGQQFQGEAAVDEAAPGGWFDCNVNYCGPAENGVIYIHLRERGNAFDRWYQAYDTMKRDMLATALTAISTGLPVTVYITTTDEYGILNRLYIRR